MSRHRYLIAYDICDEKRLRKVVKHMEGFGTRLQYSVFLCDLSQAEYCVWKDGVIHLIDADKDSVINIDLGEPKDGVVRVLGVPRSMPPSGPLIV